MQEASRTPDNLIAQEKPLMTKIDIEQLCYVRLGTARIDESARFAEEILGLERTAGVEGDIAFRASDLSQNLVFTSTADEHAVGLELRDEGTFLQAQAALSEAGFPTREADSNECKRRNVRRALLTTDASGNTIELVTRPARSGRRLFPSRDAGLVGFLGVGMRSTNIDGDVKFWTKLLDASVSDRVGSITYLQIDHFHHRIVLYPSNKNGILDIAFEVESVDCVMQSKYFLQDRQIKVLHGPGRETPSKQIFIRYKGPDDQMFSYGHRMSCSKDELRPRQFGLDKRSLCSWGSECSDVPELIVS
jgi:2,3-dihydroxy-p-cumate/2,3-dihydroxybenzoate 3,4-dioxygenase